MGGNGERRKGVSGETPSGGKEKPWAGAKPKKAMGRCADSHPPLALPGDLTVYGGSCIHPVIDDADVYIGFDHGMREDARGLPWTEGHSVRFMIPDRGIPYDAEQFKALVVWAAERLKAGDRVHAGCIGGHGRTGTFMVALAAHMGVEAPIAYVREHYCARAVETQSQIDFLKKHYDVDDAKPSHKPFKKTGGWGKKGKGVTTVYDLFPDYNNEWSDSDDGLTSGGVDDTGPPMHPEQSIWGG